MEKYLLLIRGPPGVGKSTIADLVCKKFPTDAVVVHKDMIQFQFPQKGEAPVHDIVCAIARTVLKNKMSVIIDGVYGGASAVKSIANLMKVAKEEGARFRIVFLHAHKKVCIERNKVRGQKISRLHLLKWHGYAYASKAPKGEIIDTGGLSRVQTANRVLKVVRSG